MCSQSYWLDLHGISMNFSQSRVIIHILIKYVDLNMWSRIKHCCTLYCDISYYVLKFFYVLCKTPPFLCKLLALLLEYLWRWQQQLNRYTFDWKGKWVIMVPHTYTDCWRFSWFVGDIANVQDIPKYSMNYTLWWWFWPKT